MVVMGEEGAMPGKDELGTVGSHPPPCVSVCPGQCHILLEPNGYILIPPHEFPDVLPSRCCDISID